MTFEELNSYNVSLNDSVGNSDELRSSVPYLPFFRFSLLRNGKISSIKFPKKFEKETLGMLRGFIKLFSPLLDAKLYEGEPVRKVKRKLGSNYE